MYVMRFIRIIYSLLFVSGVTAFVPKTGRLWSPPPPTQHRTHSITMGVGGDLLHIIRPNNLLPTALLCLTGGWIITPSIDTLVHSQYFILSTVETLIIMSNSMIINDIFDIEVDRINAPSKPLVKGGDTTVFYAILTSLGLVFVSQCIGSLFLPENLQLVVTVSNIIAVAYTPIFKRLPLFKNIICALLVSFSVFFGGLASSQGTLLDNNINFELMNSVTSIIFLGSLSNEIIMDIRDVKGDKENGIYTIPVILGKKTALTIANTISYFNAIYFASKLGIMYNSYIVAVLYYSILIPMLLQSIDIESETSINTYINVVNRTMMVLLFFFCILADHAL